MSKEIDEKVVEMRFDNEHFEKNVQTSMSTLDKFKQKLQFKNAGKSFEDIDRAAKKTDLSPLAKSADKVGLRFNAMYTIADQAFRNITNSAMAAGKRIVSALTIDPVKTGLSEYETKMNAVQVIQANTRGKDTMEDITAALEELNTYADKTIYNFAQMTSNVGKFTAQGFRAKEAATAVKGLANLAAASGASAEDMARATYQMSQALGGTIRMIDWNSLRNANMATVDLKNTLMDLARVNGIAIDDMIAKHGTFEQTLQDGWLTGKMFSEAMNIYSGIYSEAELKAKGFTDKQIANFMDLAKMAESAATEVKTFTQLFDVLKETAQSGWTQTWEIIFGDFDTAKSMFTELQVYFGDILNAFSDARNMFLGGALNLKNPWTKIYEKLENSSIGKVVKTFDKVSSSIENANDKLDYFQKIVNDVWRGDYKNSDTGRYELLEAAGYNHKVVQDLVNKGYNYKLTIEDIEESHKKFGLTLDGNAESLNASGDAAEAAAVKFTEITDAQLEQAGLTKDEIKLYRELAEEAERTGVTMLHLVNEMSENSGRELLIDSFKNAWSGLVTVLTAVRDAWVDVFPPMTVVQLYNIIKGVKKFSEHLIVHEETAENLTRTFKGLFAILDIILTLVSLPVKIAFKALTSLLSVLNLDVLSVTAAIGDVIVGFRDWIDSALDFTSVWKKIIPPIKSAIKAFMGWIEILKQSKNLPQDIAKGIINWFKKAFSTVTGWFGNLGEELQNGFSGASDNVVIGLVKGLWNGLKVAGQVIVEIGKTLINKFCEILGIHSPSVVFYALGGFIVSGLLMGIKAFFPDVWSTISDYALKCVDIIKGIDWGTILSAVLTGGTVMALVKVSDAIQNFSAVFEGVGDMLDDVGKGVNKFLGGIGAKFRGEAIKEIAIALLILVGAIVILTKIDPYALATSIAALGSLVIMLKYLSSSKIEFNKAEAKNLSSIVGTIVGIAASIMILAYAMKKLAELDFENDWVSIIGGMALAVGSISVLMLAYSKAAKTSNPADIAKVSSTLLAISGTMLIMAFTMKILGGLDPDEFGKGIAFVGAFGVLVVILAALSKNAVGLKTAQIGSLIKNVGLAMLSMAVACKIIATMSLDEMKKAGVGILAFAAIVAGLMLATKLATDKDVSKAGKLISSVGVAMLSLAVAGKILATMSWGDMFKAAIGLAAFSGVIAILVATTKLASDKELKRVGSTILMLSVAIGILALIATIFSFMDDAALKKGVGAVTILGVIMTAMVWATSKAQNCLGNLIVMVVALTMMATAVTVLSLIDTSKLTTSTAAMAAMMGMFALMIAATKFIDKKAMAPLIVLTGVVVALAGIVALLSLINSEKAMTSTVALIALMGAMTALILILSKIPIDVGNAIVGVVSLTLMVVPLVAFGIALNALPSLDGQEKKIGILVGVMTVMTALLLVTAAVGAIYMATGGIASTGLLGLIAMAGIMWLFSLALSKLEGFSDKEAIIVMLIGVMTTMGDLCFKLAIVGPLALIGVTALGALLALMVAFAAFATGVGYLVTEFPTLQEFLNTGIPVLEQLAHGLGSVISKFLTGLLSGLPEVGTLLTDFIDEAQGFIEGIKMVDMDVLKGVGILVTAFTTLTAMEFISGIQSFFSGGKSPFESFGSGLTSLGSIIYDFAETMSSFTEEHLTAVKRGAEAIQIMAKAASEIPNSGGLAGAFAGNNDLDTFVEMIEDVAKDLSEIIDNGYLDNLDKTTVDKIELVADMISEMSKAANKIPNSGGWAGALAGNNDIDDFIGMLSDSADDLQNFANKAKGLDDATLGHVKKVIDLMTDITSMASKIGNKSGKNLNSLGDNLASFVPNLTAFCSGMSAIEASTVSSAVDKMKELITLCSSFTKDSVTNVKNLGSALKDVAAGGIKKFTEQFSSDKSATKAINKFIATAAKNVKTKKNKEKFESVGKYLVLGIRDGITNNSGPVSTAVRKVVSDALAAAQDEADINSPSLVFKEGVGKWICQGIAEGITEDTSAEDALRIKMGNLYSAYLDLKDKWNEKTPLPGFAKFAVNNGLIRVTRTMEAEAKAAGMNVYDYIEDMYASAFVNNSSGKPVKGKASAEAIETLYKDEIESLETTIKKVDSDYKLEKLLTFNADKKRELASTYHTDQIENKKALLEQYKAMKAEYQEMTGMFSDAEIAEINETIVRLTEELTNHQEELDKLDANIAAEEAENISEKYKEIFDRIKRDMEMLDLTYKNVDLSSPNASQSVKHIRLMDHLNAELNLLKEQEETARKKFNEISKLSKSDSEEYKAAFEEWLNFKEARLAKENEKTESQEQYLQAIDAADDRVRESEYALWKARNEDASVQEKLAKEHVYLEETLKDTEEDVAKAHEEYLKVLEREGDENSEAVLAALAKWNEESEKAANLRQQITDNEKSALDAAEEASDNLRESSWELWEVQNKDVAEGVKLNAKLAYLTEKKADAAEDVVKAQEAYNKALADENSNQTKLDTLLADLNKKKKAELAIQSDITDTEKSISGLVDERRSIAYETAQIEYDIWEKTEGREAKDEEKELKQLEYLNKQLAIQNQFTNQAMNEYARSISEYGSNSVEASRAYKAYLMEIRSLSELKSEILDLEESAADRQKRLKDKQDLAQTEYEDYIKKYEKYYRANGMSRADLERDAKLVSGYDPSKIVNNITSKTKTALETITTSSNYQVLLNNFSDMGNSYVKAVNEGVASQTDTVINTTTEMVEQCVAGMLKKRSLWIEAGKYLVEGLVKGIKDERSYAINSVMRIAKDMIAAAKKELDIHSPSKAFAEIGRYSILGLVKGLVDNSGLSDDAAAHIGESAIESLKNSIRQISDVVNSDLDTQPTIRPVLDLSNIRSGTARLNAMVSNAQAIAISDSRKVRERSDENQNGNDSSTNKGNTYQFTQNNYSPKALSRTEIYRQTKNQFAAMKEVLT